MIINEYIVRCQRQENRRVGIYNLPLMITVVVYLAVAGQSPPMYGVKIVAFIQYTHTWFWFRFDGHVIHTICH